MVTQAYGSSRAPPNADEPAQHFDLCADCRRAGLGGVSVFLQKRRGPLGGFWNFRGSLHHRLARRLSGADLGAAIDVGADARSDCRQIAGRRGALDAGL